MQPELELEEGLDLPQPQRYRRRRYWPILLIIGLALCAPLAVVMRSRAEKPKVELSLKAAFVQDALRIEWNASAPEIQNARTGSLEMVDGGGQAETLLGTEDLRIGSTVYRPRTGNLLVRLKVEPKSGTPVEESLRVLVQLQPQPAESAGEVERLRAELQSQAERSAQLEAELKAVAERAERARQARLAKPLPPVPRRRAFLPPRAKSAAPATTLPAPPLLEASIPIADQHATAPALAPPPPPAPTPAPAPVAREVPKPAKPAPTSGRLIWTGTLRKNQVLSIEGGHASTGSLTGELPKAPLHVGVYSAGLSSEGLTVYSANARPREAPGPSNGWNRTVYTWDPKRTNDIVVTEAPGPRNHWNRLVLRGGAKAISVIVLEWETTP